MEGDTKLSMNKWFKTITVSIRGKARENMRGVHHVALRLLGNAWLLIWRVHKW
jgi:hypothetical protein